MFASVYSFLALLGVNLGYHRFLSHKSFSCRYGFEYLLVIIGLPAGTPIQWAGNHRAHHLYVDTKDDPHSPSYKGFWYAHCGWYYKKHSILWCVLFAVMGPFRSLLDACLRPHTNREYEYLAKDISENVIFAWLSRPFVYTTICLSHLCLYLIAGVYFFGLLNGLFFCWALSVYVYTIGDGVNSFGHMYGGQSFKSRHNAKNNKILGYLAFGDGWHANHHTFPLSAKHGMRPGQFDLAFEVLRLLKLFGAVKSLHIEDEKKIEQALENG